MKNNGYSEEYIQKYPDTLWYELHLKKQRIEIETFGYTLCIVCFLIYIMYLLINYLK